MMIFMWRSNKKRTAQQQEMRSKILPGVEVMTQAGIFGTLVEVDEADNVATIETSPGVLIRVHNQTIAHVVEPKIDVPDDASELTGTEGVDDADKPADENDSAAESGARDGDDSNENGKQS